MKNNIILIVVFSLIISPFLQAQDLAIPIKTKHYYNTLEVPGIGFLVCHKVDKETAITVYNENLEKLFSAPIGAYKGSLWHMRVFSNGKSIVLMIPFVVEINDRKNFSTEYIAFDLEGKRLGKLKHDGPFFNMIPHEDAYFTFLRGKKQTRRVVRLDNALNEIWSYAFKSRRLIVQLGKSNKYMRSESHQLVNDKYFIIATQDYKTKENEIEAIDIETGKVLYSKTPDIPLHSNKLAIASSNKVDMLRPEYEKGDSDIRHLFHTQLNDAGDIVSNEKIELDENFKNIFDAGTIYSVLKIIDKTDIGYRFIAEAITGDAFEIYQFDENFQPHSFQRVPKKMVPEKNLETSKDAKYNKLNKVSSNFNVLKIAIPSKKGDFDWLVYVYRPNPKKIQIEAVASDGSDVQPNIPDFGLDEIDNIFMDTDHLFNYFEGTRKYNGLASISYRFIQKKDKSAIFALFNQEKEQLELYNLDFDK